MAVLQKIRVQFGVLISVIIALALLSFIIDPGTLQSAVNSLSSKYDVGKVAGKRITYSDFQENIDKFTTIYQVANGSSVQNEQTQQQIRNAAWQDYLDRFVLVDNAKKAGIRVGEEELVDLTTGNNISPVLSQNMAFCDESGIYDPEILREFVQNLNYDNSGSLRVFWNYLQNSVLTEKYYEKYNALLNGSSIVPDAIADQLVKEANTQTSIEYVSIPFDFADTTLGVNSKDILAYYNSHKENYKQDAGRDIEYVVFEVVPSMGDITTASDEVEALLPEFGSTTNMKAFLLRNSERPYSEHWYKQGELRTVDQDIDDFVFSGAAGVSPVYRDGDVFRSVTVTGSAMVPDSVYVKHILLQGADAKHVADSLVGVISKGGNFASLASLYSVDKGSAADGEFGNLGWFTQTYTIPGFEGCVTAELNKPFVLNTQYGTHVVMVTKRTKPVAKKQVAILEKTALASKETFNDFYNKANRFASLTAGTYDGYKRAVDSTGVYSHTMNNVTEATENYGSVSQAKEITRWVFDAKKGKASNIITVNNNFFFVVALKDIRDKGYKTVEDVTPEIHQILFTKQLQEKTCQNVAAKIAGMSSLAEVSEAYSAPVMTADDIAVYTTGPIGVEPALAGAASVAPEGKVSGPVAGINSVYVFQVTGREEGSFFTSEDAVTAEGQKARYIAQMFMSVMMDEAGVEDNRARFF